MRVLGPRARHALVAALVVALLGGLVVQAGATPSNEQIRKAEKRASEARTRLDDLAADLEERTEDYLAADDALKTTRARISEAEAELGSAMTELEGAEGQLNGRAAAMYRNGGIDWVEVVLGATDFKDLVTRMDLMRRIGQSDADLVQDVKAAKTTIEATKSSLERRRAEQVVQRNEAREARAGMTAAVSKQKRYLAELDSDLKKLIVAEKARQEKLARERAARAAAVATSGTVGRAGRPFVASALGEPHAAVIDIARRYVGVTWYVWGGTTPSGFDCSGLVQYCYREVGINLPRTSRQQYRVGAYIPPDRLDLLQPGDLVFFGRNGDPNRVHHVAFYIGGGQMIHAPQTGELVSEASLLARIESRGDYVGGVRP